MHKGQFSSTHHKDRLYYLGMESYNLFFFIFLFKKIINMFRVLRLITYMDEIPIIGVGN
jgi:hypothetical protein